MAPRTKATKSAAAKSASAKGASAKGAKPAKPSARPAKPSAKPAKPSAKPAKPSARPKARPSATPSGEWVGGIEAMPAYVNDGGTSYRPEVLIWMNDQGFVLGTETGQPGELLTVAAESLRRTIERPMIGRPHAPQRVRVASAQLAEVLRAAHPTIDVVCAPTPELDALLAGMRAHLASEGDGDSDDVASYLSNQIEAPAVASFFRATAALFRARPWEVVPSDSHVFLITIDAFQLHEVVVSVLGRLGETFGFAVFNSIADFEDFGDAVDRFRQGQPPKAPPYLMMSFDPAAEFPEELRHEVATHRWELATQDAYPWLVSTDQHLEPQRLHPGELTIAEVISLALTRVLAEESALEAAWSGGPPLLREYTLSTHAGELQVTLRASYQPDELAPPPLGVLGRLFELPQGEAELDHETRKALEEELLQAFAASPEGRGPDDASWCELVMDAAAQTFGVTIALLEPAELEELLFDVFPRQVSVAPSEARAIIEQNRAFYRFMKRELHLDQAAECLEVLGEGAEQRLEVALSSSQNFGIGKQLIMAGQAAGYDMDTQEGIEAWMQEAQSRPLPASFHLPAPIGPAPRPGTPPPRAKKPPARPKPKKGKKGR